MMVAQEQYMELWAELNVQESKYRIKVQRKSVEKRQLIIHKMVEIIS